MATTDRQRHWLRLSRAWSRSGVSQQAFCAQQGIWFGSFAWWRCELRRRGLLEPTRPRERAVGTRDQSTTFLPVAVVRPHSTPVAPIEVVIDARRSVRVRGDFDPDVLRRVIAALEERSC